MTRKQATLIFNPFAGITGGDGMLAKFQTFWSLFGWDVTVRPSEYAGHAIVLAREAADRGDDLVFAIGGDGTANEVANGLAGSETVMAVVPTGTANVLAKELRIPMRRFTNPDWLLNVADILVHGRVQAMDVGRTDDGRYWLLWASAGLDGMLIERIEPRSRFFKRFGMAGYAAKFIINLPQVRPMKADVWVDDQHVSGDYLMVTVSNCRLYAGGEVKLNAGGQLDDGLFEVFAFQGKGLLRAAEHSLKVGLQMHEYDAKVDVFKGETVRIESEPSMAYHLDAEPSGRTPFACTIQPGALRVLAPKAAPPTLFVKEGTPLLD